MELIDLARILQANEDLQNTFSYELIIQFVDLITLLKPTLSWLQASYHSGPPATLPYNFHDFLKISLTILDHLCKVAWESFCAIAWNIVLSPKDELALRTKYSKLFLDHGISRKIGVS